MRILTIALGLVLFSIIGCQPVVERMQNFSGDGTPEAVLRAMDEYDVEQYFPGMQRDTLLTNMVTYIYRRPAEATIATRTHPRFRNYYVKSAERFEYVYHHMTEDGHHYFYVIRPARNLEGTSRGVGGKFTTNENLELVTFEEVFNTTVMDEVDLRERGLLLFEEMIAEDDVDRFLSDHTLIEWPDQRLQYNKELREWRYKD